MTTVRRTTYSGKKQVVKVHGNEREKTKLENLSYETTSCNTNYLIFHQRESNTKKL